MPSTRPPRWRNTDIVMASPVPLRNLTSSSVPTTAITGTLDRRTLTSGHKWTSSRIVVRSWGVDVPAYCSITIQESLSGLFPRGTSSPPGESPDDPWANCPPWPPDLFGYVATLADQSGAYAEPGLVLSNGGSDRAKKLERALKAKEIGIAWSESGLLPDAVQTLWAEFLAYREHYVSEGMNDSATAWKRIALELLAIADEASAGFGFIPDRNVKTLATSVFEAFISAKTKSKRSSDPSKEIDLPHVPHSIARAIAPDRLCVLPKALTPQVGCNLRSLSHHLALLPSLGTVRPSWYIGASEDSKRDRFNILLVPFPYSIGRSGFRQTCPADGTLDGHFSLDPTWMEHDGHQISTSSLAKLVENLIRATRQEIGSVNAVVFPETALPKRTAQAMAKRFAESFPDELELFVAGVMHKDHGKSRNEALLARFEKNEVTSVHQSKHHRWRLDPRQIEQYQLKRQLDHGSGWWEDIDVHTRELAFGLGRANMVISALICEDLARFDPVLPVINAIGPNLLIALLMDGPQLQSRWPGRYATVLAEDPGSAVLTLTSIGMINLSRRKHEEPCRVIALWKDARGPAVELLLPQGAHALALSVEVSNQTQYTMDLRDDRTSSVSLRLDEVWPVVLSSPPQWITEVPNRSHGGQRQTAKRRKKQEILREVG
jgi:hypothetical protein